MVVRPRWGRVPCRANPKKNRQRQGNNTPVRDIQPYGYKPSAVPSQRATQPSKPYFVVGLHTIWHTTVPHRSEKGRSGRGRAGRQGRKPEVEEGRGDDGLGWKLYCFFLGGGGVQEPPPRCTTPALAEAAGVTLIWGLVRQHPSASHFRPSATAPVLRHIRLPVPGVPPPLVTPGWAGPQSAGGSDRHRHRSWGPRPSKGHLPRRGLEARVGMIMPTWTGKRGGGQHAPRC